MEEIVIRLGCKKADDFVESLQASSLALRREFTYIPEKSFWSQQQDKRFV